MGDVVLDTSAFLALVRGERGWDNVVAVLPGSVICSVNAAEAYARLSDWSYTRDQQAKCHLLLKDRIVPFDTDLALRSGALRGPTKAEGLSLGDRACLALAQRLGVPAVTADQAWKKLNIGVTIEMIR
jgi:ribonuclease VapC